jgi:hypothetical protein
MNNKDLIKQYVNTGIQISEYQFMQLNDNFKKTYLRKRIMTSDNSPLVDYEFLSLPDDVRTEYVNKLDSDEIEKILRYSNDPDKVINILLEYY